MRFRLPLLRRQVRILRSPLACSAPVPTSCGTGGSAVRRAGSVPARQLPPTRQREPLCRDPSRLDARSPRTPRDARIRATGRPTGPLQRATHSFPCHARTLSLCWCIPQAAVRYAAATRAVDAGQASRRNVGVSADNDCLGSRQSGTTIPLRHQGVTRRVFSRRLAASRPNAASAACHYPLRQPPPFAPPVSRGSDRRQHYPVESIHSTRPRGGPGVAPCWRPDRDSNPSSPTPPDACPTACSASIRMRGPRQSG